MRIADVYRRTDETEIKLYLSLDGSGEANIDTPVPFLNHMLDLFAKHGFFDLDIEASGDVEIDDHHIVEDIGIVLGQAIKEALEDKSQIVRYGNKVIPMDEALIQASLDCGGRYYLNFAVEGLKDKVGSFDTELVEEFFRAVAFNAAMNLHIRKISGINTHHIIEGILKSFARALDEAIAIDKRIEGVMSSKGKL